MKRVRHVHIYKSPWHALVTFAFILAPLIILIAFSQAALGSSYRLFGDLGVSTARMFVGFIFSALFAWVFAVAMYKRANTVVLPLFDVLQSFPAFAILPIVTYLFGASEWVILAFLFLNITWPIFFSVLTSLRLIRRDWEEAVEIMGLKGWPYYLKFLIPASLPGLITGSIIGLGDGWQALVATEVIVQTKIGLGGFFDLHATDPAITTYGVLVFLAFIFIINRLIWTPLMLWSQKQMEE